MSEPAATPPPTPAAPAPSPTPLALRPAGVVSGTTYTFDNSELCSTNGSFVVNSGGDVTVNLDGLPDASVNSVILSSWVADACLSSITSLTINPRTSGIPVTDLEVADGAFNQAAGTNSLAAVSFPSGLISLTIGVNAFRQESSGGGAHNALTSVTFPSGLDSLTIGESAFAQFTEGAGVPNALTQITFPTGLKTLAIDAAAFGQSASGVNTHNALASVTFPDSLTSLSIGQAAFAQMAQYTNSRTALTSIHFPDGLSSLSIGASAFMQSAAGGTTLEEVSFPVGLQTLAIDVNAFAQESGSDTALTSVTFPEGLETLTLGGAAFAQLAEHATTLASVTFPDSLTRLDVAQAAFLQWSTNSALKWVSLPGHLTRLTVGSEAFMPYCGSVSPKSVATRGLSGASIRPAGMPSDICGPIQVIFRATVPMTGAYALSIEPDAVPAGTSWMWFGPDGFTLADAWNNPGATLPTATLAGYRTISFETDGGSLPVQDAGLRLAGRKANTWFVYTNGHHGTKPWVAWKGAVTPNDWTITLPSATRAGSTLAGWCTDAGCANRLAVGASFAVPATDLTLYSSWTVAALPVFTTDTTLGGGASGEAYRQSVNFTGTTPITCAVASGKLPAGLTLTDCVISGTPTESGTFTFTIAATNAAGTTSKEFQIVIAAPTPSTPSPGHELAHTGAGDLAPITLVAALLIAVGVGLRVRRSAH